MKYNPSIPPLDIDYLAHAVDVFSGNVVEGLLKSSLQKLDLLPLTNEQAVIIQCVMTQSILDFVSAFAKADVFTGRDIECLRDFDLSEYMNTPGKGQVIIDQHGNVKK